MSERSAAWYAVPENAKRRKARMRLYARALGVLAREYPERYRALYRQGRDQLGLSGSAAQGRAHGIIRDWHPERFSEIYGGLLLAEEQDDADGG